MLVLFLIFSVLTFVARAEECPGSQCECGISTNLDYYEGFNPHHKAENRILGGHHSLPSDWPFVARLDSGCTATIIGDQWLLSAASCLPAEGSLAFTINDEKYQSKAIYAHENFTNAGDTKSNDIMLIKSSEPFNFTDNVSTLCLHRNLEVPALEVGVVIGYGSRFYRVETLDDTNLEKPLDPLQYIHDIHSPLRETPVLIREFDYCQEKGDANRICVGGANRGTTPGDSGAPLLVIRGHKWVQYGVSSYETIYGISGDILAVKSLGVFTKVSAYCDWIEEKTAGDVKCQ